MATNPQVESLEDLMRRMGSEATVAGWLGMGRSAVSEIKRRKPGRLRPEYWMRFVSGAQTAGHKDVTYEYVAFVHAMEHDTLPPKAESLKQKYARAES
jgi:hypothetical protein